MKFNRSNNQATLPPEKSDDRWWEFYVIRYAMPSVIGFLILWGMRSEFTAFTSIISESANIKIIGEISLFAGLGFVYCYVASTPILVMHCCRYNLKRFNQMPTFAGLVTVALILFTALVVSLKGWSNFFSMQYALVPLVIFGLILIIIQFCLLLDLRLGYKDFGRFYRELESKRKQLGELKNTYQHMREHGNSALIVVLEVVLAGFLYSLIQVAKHFDIGASEMHWILLFAFAIWVSPAAFVWYVAGVILESELTTQYFDGN